MLKSVAAICVGACLGSLSRWQLGVRLNALLPDIPPGTLASNLIGGYIIGVAVAFFSTADVAPEWRLLIITGFCGGLTTFSSFSAEVVALIESGDLTKAMLAIAMHLVGSLLMTIIGIASWQWLTAR